jgi:hypothetical protein
MEDTAKRFWAQYSIRKALQTLAYWRTKIKDGGNDNKSLERYAMWWAYIEDERTKAGVPPRKRQGERGKDTKPRKRADRTVRVRQAAVVPPAWVPPDLRWD